MKFNRLVAFAVVLLALAVAPAFAQNTIFNNGFEDGLCSWGPSGCVIITPLDSSAASPVSGHEEWADYEIEFAVWTPIDLYIEKEGARSTSPDLTKGFWFAIKNTGGVYEGGITPFSMTAFCPCNDTPTHFKIAANTSRTFRFNVRLDNAGGIAGFYKAQLIALSYKFDGTNGDGTVLVTKVPGNLDTTLVSVNNQDTNNVGIDSSSYDDFHLMMVNSIEDDL